MKITEAIFNSAAGVRAMNYWVSLVDTGLASKACAEYNQPQADAAFISGETAMIYGTLKHCRYRP